jgi:hypothetical protein
LEHIGSSLSEFLAGVPPRELTATERLARALSTRTELRELVEALMPVPKPRVSEVLDAVRVIAPLAIAKRAGRTGGEHGASAAGARGSKSPPRTRRRAQGRKMAE